MFNSFILKNKMLALEELCIAPSACAPAFHVLVQDLSWQSVCKMLVYMSHCPTLRSAFGMSSGT